MIGWRWAPLLRAYRRTDGGVVGEVWKDVGGRWRWTVEDAHGGEFRHSSITGCPTPEAASIDAEAAMHQRIRFLRNARTSAEPNTTIARPMGPAWLLALLAGVALIVGVAMALDARWPELTPSIGAALEAK